MFRAHAHSHGQLKQTLGLALPHLVPRPPLQAVRVELVHIQHVDGTFNAEVMQLAAHFKNQQVVLRKSETTSMWCCTPKKKKCNRNIFTLPYGGVYHSEVLEHPPVYTAFVELVFILR